MFEVSSYEGNCVIPLTLFALPKLGLTEDDLTPGVHVFVTTGEVGSTFFRWRDLSVFAEFYKTGGCSRPTTSDL